VSLLLFAMACRDPEVEEWQCVGPLVDLVTWRDGIQADLSLGRKAPPDLAAQEQAHIDAAVAALRDRKGSCEMAWSMLLFQKADNPSLVLRERAVHTLLGSSGSAPDGARGKDGTGGGVR
jgi:hypothetical protein